VLNLKVETELLYEVLIAELNSQKVLIHVISVHALVLQILIEDSQQLVHNVVQNTHALAVRDIIQKIIQTQHLHALHHAVVMLRQAEAVHHQAEVASVLELHVQAALAAVA
jgi:hypothetical protein